MRILIYFIFLLQAAHADSVVKITSPVIQINQFTIGYFIDESKTMPLQEVMEQTFEEGSNNLTLGTTADVTWIKIDLFNDTDTSKKLYIHNSIAYHATEIHFYEMQGHTLLNDMTFGPHDGINIDKMSGAEAIYPVVLAGGEHKSIYMKSYFQAYQFVELSIFDEKSSQEDLVHHYISIVVLFTILFTLALYYFILYISSGYKEYIFYVLYLTSSALFLAYSYGMASHYFHIYGELGRRLTAFAIVSPIFLSFFIKVIFNTKERYVLQNKFINSVIVLFSLTYLYSFYDHYLAIELTSLLFLYFLIIMLWVSISLYKLNAPLIKYFFIAHVFYLIFSLIAILFYNNMIGYTFITSHAIAIGTMLEALMLGFLISYRIKLLEDDNQRKEKLIITDIMTTLYNKSYFDITLERELLIHRREKTNLTLMIIDIDFFKEYNDTYGHVEGDKTLIRVSKALKDSLKRSTDMAFRIGGEEFAIVFSDIDENIARTFSHKMVAKIEALKIEHKRSQISQYLTISIGVCTVPTQYNCSSEKLYRQADSALYEAKSKGRNQVVIYKN